MFYQDKIQNKIVSTGNHQNLKGILCLLVAMQSTSNSLRIFALVAFFLTHAPGTNGTAPRGSKDRSILLRTQHIVGGDFTDIQQCPYQISIELLRVHACGGAILTERWAVSTGHCIHWARSFPLSLKRIRAGSTTVFPFFGWGGNIHQISAAKWHPRYTVEGSDYNIAVVKVANKFVFGAGVQPIPVPNENENDFIDYSKNATISGWGLTRLGDTFLVPTFSLKRAQIPLVPRDKCKDLLGQEIPSRMICGAGGGSGGPCKGDSGGPVIQKGHLIGLTSWENDNCDFNSIPAVFTNVLNNEIRGFIRANAGV